MGDLRDIKDSPEFINSMTAEHKKEYLLKKEKYLLGKYLLQDPKARENVEGDLQRLEKDCTGHLKTGLSDCSTGLSDCSLCCFRKDIRGWWKRLIRPPDVMDLVCKASPRKEVRSYITGQRGFLPAGIRIPHDDNGKTYLQSETYDWCLEINILGTCSQFKPTVRYGK